MWEDSLGKSRNSAKVTATDLRDYLELFHTTLQRRLKNFFPELRTQMQHLEFRLKSGATFQLKTEWPFEYVPDDGETKVDTFYSSSRIEDLFLQPPAAVQQSFVFTPQLRGCAHLRFERIAFKKCFPFLQDSNDIVFKNCHCETDEWKRDIVYAEFHSDRLRDSWSRERAIERAKNEVLSAVVDQRRATAQNLSLREYIEGSKKRNVLVLGKYDEGQGEARLAEISEVLRAADYRPILIRDVEEHVNVSLSQKVTVNALTSRFVVIDDTFPSGHLLEIHICKQSDVTTVVLRPRGQPSTYMAAGLEVVSRAIREQPYEPGKFRAAVQDGINWAESQ